MVSDASRNSPAPPGQRVWGSQDGFTLLELTVAVLILVGLLTALLPLHVSAMSTIALAKQRQQASQLANEVQEQLRALPYDVVVAGLNTADLAGDPNIVSGRFKPTFDTSIDEKLQVSSSTTQAPLNPHRQTRGPINNVRYDVATYVSQVNGANPLQYWLTVVTTWTSPATRNTLKRQVSRSRLFSPAGCLSTATHPFSGPCQPFVYGTAGTSPGSIAVRPLVEGQQIVPGLDALAADLVLPQVDGDYQVEQIVRSGAKAQTSGALVVKSGGVKEAVGGVVGRAATDTDPGTTSTGDVASAPAQSSPVSVTASGGGSSLSLTTTDGDSGKASSSTAASAGSQCLNLADTSLTTLQPCGSGQVTAQGTGGTADLVLDVGGQVLGTTRLASIGPSQKTRTFATRFTAPGTDYCRTADGASDASGTDCSVAVVRRSIGTVQSGALPAGGAGLPAGFGGHLFELTGYRDRVVAQSARTGPLSSASSATVEAGTLTYWNGTAYETLPLGVPATRSSAVTAQYGTVSVTAALTLKVGGASKSQDPLTLPATGATCAAPCVVKATVESPVTADVVYTVKQGATTYTQFRVTTGLGSSLATATYKAAPSA